MDIPFNICVYILIILFKSTNHFQTMDGPNSYGVENHTYWIDGIYLPAGFKQ